MTIHGSLIQATSAAITTQIDDTGLSNGAIAIALNGPNGPPSQWFLLKTSAAALSATVIATQSGTGRWMELVPGGGAAPVPLADPTTWATNATTTFTDNNNTTAGRAFLAPTGVVLTGANISVNVPSNRNVTVKLWRLSDGTQLQASALTAVTTGFKVLTVPFAAPFTVTGAESEGLVVSTYYDGTHGFQAFNANAQNYGFSPTYFDSFIARGGPQSIVYVGSYSNFFDAFPSNKGAPTSNGYPIGITTSP